MKRFISWLWKYLKPFTNWRFVISFGLAWIITNGMWYAFAFISMRLPDWLIWFSRSYIAFLYIPTTPEKLITIPLAIFVHWLMIRKDIETRKQLDDMYAQAKSDWQKAKFKVREFIRKIKIKIAIIKQRKVMKKNE